MTDVNPNAVNFEDEDEDIELDKSGAFRDAVVSGSDWTVQTVLDQLERGNIQLNPRFQRRDAWTRPRKSRFIESLILGLPIPQIVLAEKKDERRRFIVLDGKQRLMTLLQFTGGAGDESKNNNFKLTGLDALDELRNLTYSDLASSPELRDVLTEFENQTIRTVVIRNWPNMSFLHLVFLRLNTGSVKLAAQELRQAMFPGPFTDFSDQHSISSDALRRLLRLDEPDFRMRDVELLIRYFGFANFISQYRGELKLFLDAVCDRLNRDWTTFADRIQSQAAEFDAGVNAAVDVFGTDDVARRPHEEGVRRPFNRAIFDAQIFYFRVPEIRAAALKHRAQVQAAFDHLWNNDDGFVSSVQSSTKTIQATHTRLSRWGIALAEACKLEFQVPKLTSDGIEFAGF